MYIAHSFSTMFGRASIPPARIAHVRLNARELHLLASALAIEAEGEVCFPHYRVRVEGSLAPGSPRRLEALRQAHGREDEPRIAKCRPNYPDLCFHQTYQWPNLAVPELRESMTLEVSMSRGILPQQQPILGAALAISRIRNGEPVDRTPQRHPRFRVLVVTGVWPDISTYIASHLVGRVGLRRRNRWLSRLETTPTALATRRSISRAIRFL